MSFQPPGMHDRGMSSISMKDATGDANININ